MVIPFLIFSRANYKTNVTRIAWILIFALSSILQLLLARIGMRDILADIYSLKSAAVIFLYALLWIYTTIYLFSAPPISKKKSTLEDATGVIM